MPTYVRLIKMTEQGVRNVKNAKQIVDDAAKIFKANSGKIVSVWSTLGRYDFIGIVEAPDDATMMKISAHISSGGDVTAETLPAVPMGDFVSSLK